MTVNNYNEAKRTIDAFASMGLHDFNIHINPHTEMRGLPPLDGSKGTLYPHKVEEMTGSEILADFERFYKKNKQGYNIQFTPKKMNTDLPTDKRQYHPYIFLDDVTPLIMQNMKNDGMHMNIIIASSTGNYHGWVKVADHILSYKQLTVAQNALVIRYGTDTGGKTPSHFGKLPGTFNNKPGYSDMFIRLAYSNPAFENNTAFVGSLAQRLAANKAFEAQQMMEKRKRTAFQTAKRGDLPHISEFVSQKQSKYPIAQNNDLDFSLIMACLARGYDDETVIEELTAQYIASASDEQRRKKGNVRDYIKRSVKKAALSVNTRTKV